MKRSNFNVQFGKGGSVLLFLTLVFCQRSLAFQCGGEGASLLKLCGGRQHPSSQTILWAGVADPPIPPAEHRDDKKKRGGDDEDGAVNGEGRDGEDWTPHKGGFLPNLFLGVRRKSAEVNVGKLEKETKSKRRILRKLGNKSSSTGAITKIEDIISYKQHVAEEREAIIVVRFHAAWCKSCRVSSPLFRKLAANYEAACPNLNPDRKRVKFVEVPLTKSTAHLHEGLGVKSVPFVHVYHPEGGLVEEMRLSKREYGDFAETLETYVNGYCDVPSDEGEEEEFSIFE
jgi:thiol-disulfide isomerase/thioredoxin